MLYFHLILNCLMLYICQRNLSLKYLIFQTSSANSSIENSPATPPDEQGQGDAPPQHEDEEPAFPHADLAKLDDMINR